jgi:RimJ/RimL family protein N-acetyltransferase
MIETERLRLVPMTVSSLAGLIARDRELAESDIPARFPEPLRPPPETADALVFFRDLVAEGTTFPPYFIVRGEDQIVVGAGGVNAPDEAGVAIMGYGIYPEFEGSGYASEAATAFVDWARTMPGVRMVRATIEIGHIASERVARNAGLEPTGKTLETEGMTVGVWEILLAP